MKRDEKWIRRCAAAVCAGALLSLPLGMARAQSGLGSAGLMDVDMGKDSPGSPISRNAPPVHLDNIPSHALVQALGLTLQSLSIPDLPVLDSAAHLAERVTDSDIAVAAVSYAETIRTGWNIDPARLLGYSLRGLKTDVTLIEPSQKILPLVNGSIPVTLNAKLDVSYRSTQLGSARFPLIFEVDGSVQEEGEFRIRASGMEMSAFNRALEFKMGYEDDPDATAGFSVGLGFRPFRGCGALPQRCPALAKDIVMDYTLAGIGELGQVHRASLTLKFGSADQKVN
ncbi:MAG: hypothetical protein HY551_07505 [Elusimicrobia bacterium]|nr:hypothetical protein [Elusimicrobiota bacterium]